MRRGQGSMLRASLLALATSLHMTFAGEYEHMYEESEDVTLWVNKVGPYHNPQETYLYYSLPFCSTKPVAELEHRYDSFGEILEGNDMISSGLAFKFRQPVADHSKICTLQLTEESIAQLQYAVKNHCMRIPVVDPTHCLPLNLYATTDFHLLSC